ncbi:hypothetical protein HQQ80_09375 [Microbacteriaceae bacterium VKM Ac-2855]|nr:hypothetical protein [Microbacteriaceae bacterium VKM Ac-2855]
MSATGHTYADAYRKYIQAVLAASVAHNPDLTEKADAKARLLLLDAARTELIAATPPAPANVGRNRAAYLDSLAPSTADAVVVLGNEQRKVSAILASGTQRIDQIISDASPSRLAAILDTVETLSSVLDAPRPADEAQALRERVFDQLAQIEAPGAQEAADADAATDRQQAWHAVLADGLAGRVGYDERAAIHQLDPEGYEAAFGGGAPDLANTIAIIEENARKADWSGEQWPPR